MIYVKLKEIYLYIYIYIWNFINEIKFLFNQISNVFLETNWKKKRVFI